MTSSFSAASPADHEHLLQGRYRITRSLGSGGMGDVHLAEDLRLGRLVAVKSIKREFCKMEDVRKRIERECVMHAQMGAHPNIIPLYDRVEEDGRIHLVMEFVDGTTLKDLIDRARLGELYLTWRESASIACQVLEALSRIHALGVVHRDVKPANVMLVQNETGNYVAKLMDFGIARLLNPVDGATMLTRQGGSGPGTPIYMSPEQIAGEQYGALSPATDIYAMGVMLYQMLTGHPPFQGTITDIFHGHLNTPPPPVDGISDTSYPRVVTEIVHKAMAKHPVERFTSATEFRYWLRVVVKSRGPITSLALAGPVPSTASEVNAGATVPLTPMPKSQDTSPGAGPMQRREVGAKSAKRTVAVVAVVLLALASAAVANLYFSKTSTPDAVSPTPNSVVGTGLSASPVLAMPAPTQPDTPAPVSMLPESVPLSPAPAPVSAADSIPVVISPAPTPAAPVPEQPAPVALQPKSSPKSKTTVVKKEAPAKKDQDLVSPEDETGDVAPDSETRRTPVPRQTPVPAYTAPPAQEQTPVPRMQTPVPPAYPPHYAAPQSSSERAADMFKDMRVNKLPSTRVN
ncbi:MAG: protein kinase [Candidatus Hydrogenedentes bacterium]|nr:protein kinase [Candidatus Hydrogenedentota bacterium]